MPGTPANSLNLTSAGLVRFDGVSVFSGVTTTLNRVLIGAASNGITSLAAGLTNQVLVGNTGLAPSFGAVPAGALPGSGQITLSNGTNISVTGSPVTLGGTATINVSGPPSATTLTNHGVVVGQGTSAVVATAAGSTGQVLQSGGASADPSYSTATYPSTATGTGTILRADGTNWVATTATYPTTTTASQLLYSSSNNVVGGLTSANNGTLVTSNTGVPSILAGPGTTGNILQSNSAAAPSFSTATYPSTTTINQVLYSSANNVVGGITAANNGTMISGTTGIPSWLANGTTGQVLTATTSNPPSWATPTFVNVRSVTSPGAYPYTTLTTDSVIIVDSSSPRTITPLGSPATGQFYTIKDSVGSAATNNITVTPSGKNIDGAASFVINTNYGSIDIVYNGTEWSVI